MQYDINFLFIARSEQQADEVRQGREARDLSG